MQFTLHKLVAFAVAAQAIGIASAANATAAVSTSTSSVSPLDFSTGISCVNSFLSGACGTHLVSGIPSECRTFFSSFNDDISSIQVISGFACHFFVDPNCSGAVITITGTVNDLAGTNFENSLSSYRCLKRSRLYLSHYDSFSVPFPPHPMTNLSAQRLLKHEPSIRNSLAYVRTCVLPAPNSVACPSLSACHGPASVRSASSPRLLLLHFHASCSSSYNALAYSAVSFPRPLIDHSSPFDDSHPSLHRPSLRLTCDSLVHLTSPHPRLPLAHYATPHSSLPTSNLLCIYAPSFASPNTLHRLSSPRTHVYIRFPSPIPSFSLAFPSSSLQRISPPIRAVVSALHPPPRPTLLTRCLLFLSFPLVLPPSPNYPSPASPFS
ncbi:hypothetical protein B0H13DRAFT_2304175 [Mycena leptocephala]|nr:hypothetical protein B0H13DRAFT_2304175 [Mycena leptocephala]